MRRAVSVCWAVGAVTVLVVYGCSSDPSTGPTTTNVDNTTLDGGANGPAENTFTACTDNKDNDSDGKIDCADPDCAALVVCSAGPDGGRGNCASCDDSLSCTLDGCDAVGACTHAVKQGTCLIDKQCWADGQKNGGNCQYCDATKSPTAWTNIVGGCTINGYCYRKGEKSSDGCYVCDPARAADAWSPVLSSACNVGGRCYDEGEKDTTGCQMCNSALSKTSLSPAPYACQISGQCYPEGAKHPSSTCTTVVCDSKVSSSAWTVNGNECLYGGQCYAAGQKTTSGCLQCIPSQSKTTLTASTYACQIGGYCYANGDKHPNGSCTSVTCDATKSTTSWTIAGNECLISGVCRQAGDRTANNCSECNPAVSKTSWSAMTTGCSIGGYCYASGTTHPSGTCSTTTCSPSSSTSSWTTSGNECLIGNQCYAAGAFEAGFCRWCNPSVSKNAWSPATTSCTIGGSCYQNGSAHPSATCSSYSVTCNSGVSTTQWTVGGNACAIGSQCYANGALDPTGCAHCDTAASKTSWRPEASCNKIILAALNEGRQGNLGGIAGASSLCAQQAPAAGYGGTWKAFLSSSAQNVKDLITGTNATNLPVINLKGETMFSSWNNVFLTTLWSSSAPNLWSFDGNYVGSGRANPDWYVGRGWNGSSSSGTYSGYTCSDWTSTSSSTYGSYGELDSRYLFYSTTHSCSNYLAVVCVSIPQ